jgi:hypothetical protein
VDRADARRYACSRCCSKTNLTRPRCEKEIATLNAKKITSFLGVRYIYYCAKCRKTLGVSQRKGFWMG